MRDPLRFEGLRCRVRQRVDERIERFYSADWMLSNRHAAGRTPGTGSKKGQRAERLLSRRLFQGEEMQPPTAA
jgi:hypothetical protein